ncbi:nitroreductase family protein [Microbacterium laevaniformans]|uniref:nitroreductase family protein n=1 Tax=Microbacterium TaxID=33882 RepID=UPI0009656183|nr:MULTISPECIES: nitroreductase family protein [Microbacterium]MBM7753741.1 nitroreductase [Microbacterium laevaniformans]OJU43918.1 MAG: nitroreductase [Microbacterium sp. 69-7]GLJ64296.1 oxidoreductase [Microbacterium laevaniformans]
MSTIAAHPADTDAPILDVLAERWSTRIFDPATPIDEQALASALEAARWAPSANNTQPWRFVVARRGSAAHAQIVDALMGFNQSWAADAAALVVFASAAALDGKPLPWAAYDTGQAAAHFTVQAHASGLHTHQMGGFDRDAIAAAFGFGDDLVAVTVMAVGALGDIDAAPEALRERELAPRVRRPIAESLIVND